MQNKRGINTFSDDEFKSYKSTIQKDSIIFFIENFSIALCYYIPLRS